MKGIKTVPLTVLSLFFYALSTLLQYRIALFPLPANDYINLLVISYLFFINRKEIQHAYFLLIFLFFSIIQTPYNLELFLSNQTINSLTNSLFFDINSLLGSSFLIVYIYKSTKQKTKTKIDYLPYLAILSTVVGLFFTPSIIHVFTFSFLIAFFTVKHRNSRTINDHFNLHVFILLAFIKLTFIYSTLLT